MTKKKAKAGKRFVLIAAALAGGAVLVIGCANMMSSSGGGGAGGAKPVSVSDTPVVTSSVRRSLEAFQGRVVILDFWATWCPPCRAEIPDFITLQNQYRAQGLEVVGVSIDPIAPQGGGAPAVAPFMKRYGINYTILMVNDPSAMDGYEVNRGIPTTFIIDRGGRITKTYVGQKTLRQFEQDIKALL